MFQSRKFALSRKGPELDVIAIDHLPTLLPREASTAFGNDLFESLVALKDRKSSPVWAGADALFIEKCRELAAIFKK